MNHLIFVPLCFFGLVVGKHLLIETENGNHNDYNDYKGKTKSSIPCIPINEKNTDALLEMYDEAGKFIKDYPEVMKTFISDGAKQKPKPIKKGDKVTKKMMKLVKNFREKIQGMVDKEAKKCMEFDGEGKKLLEFVFRTYPEDS